MIKAVIVDDEQNNIDNLVQLLAKHCQQVQVTGHALNADDGEEVLHALQPDLVFLDIQMPGKTGFDLLRSITFRNFAVIFVTAYDNYGIQAIKFSAIDYLLKPVNAEELKHAVSKAIELYTTKKQNLLLENLLLQLQQTQQKEQHRIALPSSKETRFILTADIIRCEASNNYTTFFIRGNEKIMVSKPIYEYEEILSGYHFIRCHQTHLVNKHYIKSWVKEDGGYLLLADETKIPVSKQKREFVKGELGRG
jgi:two-component system LytT family response regulator